MRKMLVFVLIGVALAIYLYGIVSKFTVDEVKEVDHIEKTTITVYVE